MADNNVPSRPSSDTAVPADSQDAATLSPAGPYVGRPLDGSQYLDVVEEQEYANRRPAPDEQRPRFASPDAKESQSAEGKQ
ncbi:MAG TPA: hypothetical protein VIM12_00470 [Noviherbaspirillum sp.]|jgi:hypothetical protein|uniref:hypothetical protein n=1 Tax=Noviherbaspirillum sp. TaxID=1926288 RepID=UPI002F924460